MLWQECEKLQPELVSLRRRLHQIPEVGHELPETQRAILEILRDWGIPCRPSGKDSSIYGEIAGGQPGKTVLLRADIDGLAVEEQTGLPFASRHAGRMHACGHDGHAAMLLGALKVLNAHRERLKGKVRFIFQAAEECVTGAALAIQEGILEDVDGVFGCHIGNLPGADIPAGTFHIAPGPVMAAGDRLFLRIQGKGCHGSSPEKGVDPVTIAAHIVLALQELLAREIPAAAAASLTIGRIQGGAVFNVVPDWVEMEGSLRTLDPAVRQLLQRRIREVAEGEAALFRGSCDARVIPAVDVVNNDPALAELAAEAACQVVGERWVQTRMTPNMGSEDFSCYQAKTPGVFFFLSAANPEKGTCVPHHNPRFDIDEDVLWKGSGVFVSIVERFLA